MSMSRVLALAVLPAIVACGSSSSPPASSGTGQDAGGGNQGTPDAGGGNQGTPDAGGDSGSGGEADSGASTGHAPFPTIVNQGVPAMTSPKIVAVTFSTSTNTPDPNAAAIGSFLTELGTTDYWNTVTKDYGIGAATGSSLASTATLAATYTDNPGQAAAGTFPVFVASTLSAASMQPDANTIYAFFLPSTTAITIGSGDPTSPTGTTCTNVGGYHSAAAASGGGNYIYAVIPECNAAAIGSRKFASELDLITFEASHEILEAATDPTISIGDIVPVTVTGGWYNDFAKDLVDDYAWNTFGDGEVADFCVDQFGPALGGTPLDTASAGTNVVQRIWSVSAAKAGHNPCVPIPSGEVYFNAAPAEGSDIVIVNGSSPTTIEVDAFSDAAKSWTLLGVDSAVLEAQPATMTLSFANGSMESIGQGISLPSIPATNGAKAQLSVTLLETLSPPTNTSAGTPFALGFLVSHDGTSLVGAPAIHNWPFLVTTPDIAKSIGADFGQTFLLSRTCSR